MAINLTRRPDLEDRIEILADRLDLKDRDHRTRAHRSRENGWRPACRIARPSKRQSIDTLPAEPDCAGACPGGRIPTPGRRCPCPSNKPCTTNAVCLGGRLLDTSAILAILLQQAEATTFRNRIAEAGGAMVSAGTAVELAAVASRDDAVFAAALAFLPETYISVEPLDAESGRRGRACVPTLRQGPPPARVQLGRHLRLLPFVRAERTSALQGKGLGAHQRRGGLIPACVRPSRIPQ